MTARPSHTNTRGEPVGNPECSMGTDNFEFPLTIMARVRCNRININRKKSKQKISGNLSKKHDPRTYDPRSLSECVRRQLERDLQLSRALRRMTLLVAVPEKQVQSCFETSSLLCWCGAAEGVSRGAVNVCIFMTYFVGTARREVPSPLRCLSLPSPPLLSGRCGARCTIGCGNFRLGHDFIKRLRYAPRGSLL